MGVMRDVQYAIENEGMDYAFRNYSDFDEVDDEEFHELRKIYIKAADAIEEYVLEKSKEKNNG